MWACAPPTKAVRVSAMALHCLLTDRSSHTDRRQCLIMPVVILAAFGASQRTALAAVDDDDTAAVVFEATSASLLCQSLRLMTTVVAYF